MPSSESPAPPHTATLDTSVSGSPAARTPHDVCGKAPSTRDTNADSGSGCANVPMRPSPASEGGGTSAKMSNAGSSYGWAARKAASTAARARAGAMTSNRSSVTRSTVPTLPIAGDAPSCGRNCPIPVTLQLHCE